jgi:hypothetical protein
MCNEECGNKSLCNLSESVGTESSGASIATALPLIP